MIDLPYRTPKFCAPTRRPRMHRYSRLSRSAKWGKLGPVREPRRSATFLVLVIDLPDGPLPVRLISRFIARCSRMTRRDTVVDVQPPRTRGRGRMPTPVSGCRSMLAARRAPPRGNASRSPARSWPDDPRPWDLGPTRPGEIDGLHPGCWGGMVLFAQGPRLSRDAACGIIESSDELDGRPVWQHQ